jgi:hypothetical protein
MAFLDARSKGEVAVLEARAAQRKAELEFTEEQLARIAVRADRAGIAVFRDPTDWIGRPVGTGERVLIVADPTRVEVRMNLSVDDLVRFEEAARVQLFLNTDPLNPLEAVLTEASYEAVPTGEGVLAYRLTAQLSGDGPPPRIGLKGTAKIYGESVRLIWFLLRKPVSAARRALGI